MHRAKHCIWLLCLISCLAAHDAQALLLLKIGNLSNITLPNWSIGDPAPSASLDICVYGTLSDPYAIMASSPGGFFLSSGTNTIPYTLFWDDGGVGNLGTNGGASLANNSRLTNRRNSDIVSQSCTGGNTARLNIKITQAAMNAALAGTYTGTVTLLISPL